MPCTQAELVYFKSNEARITREEKRPMRLVRIYYDAAGQTDRKRTIKIGNKIGRGFQKARIKSRLAIDELDEDLTRV